jgi:copper chaperone
MKKITHEISGMSCNHCVMSVKKELSKLALESYNVQIGSAEIVYDEEKSNNKKIIAAIEEAGFKVTK